MNLFKIQNLNFSYVKDKQVLSDINIEFKPKTINVLLGLNGSGKTTLIKILSNVLKSKEGIVTIDNQDISRMTDLERSKYIAYVQQSYDTGDGNTVYDYLSFGLTNKLKFYESPEDFIYSDIIRKAATKFNIDSKLEETMASLSGGYKQIAAICRAYIQDTPIIILDEPTSALDWKNRANVLRILKDLSLNDEKTIILSTHNPNDALALKSNVIGLHKSKIVFQGSYEKIIKPELLKIIYGNQIVYSNQLEHKELAINI